MGNKPEGLIRKIEQEEEITQIIKNRYHN
jgi:hypothetical protein